MFLYKVSLIIPVYQPREDEISRLFDSIFRQTIGFEENVEMIIVVDGDQTSKTREILEPYRKRNTNNISIVQYEENRGPGYARTLGI